MTNDPYSHRPEYTQPVPPYHQQQPHGRHRAPDSEPTQPVPQPPPPPPQEPIYHPSTDLTQPVRAQQVQALQEPPRTNFGFVLLSLAIGSLVSVGIGVYAAAHQPTGFAFNLGLFTSGLSAKAWLASVALLLAVVQVVTSLMIYGKLPGGGRVTAGLHRWSGRIAVLVTLPVAAHCLYALGFSSFDTRTLLHSLLGCFFYGIFVCKMLVLTRDDGPKWALPLFGGLVFTGLTGLWLTSSLWFFGEYGLIF